jgi:two-component sensor histidine kinase
MRMRAESEGASAMLDLPQASIYDERLLLREMTHRVSNEFASAVGLVNTVAAQSINFEVKQALANIAEHLHNYARLHQALQAPSTDQRIDVARYVRSLCQLVSLSKLQHRGIELIFVEHALQLSATKCWHLGLILVELITNSSRHAFHDRGGIIRIEIQTRGSFVECSVIDNGCAAAASRPGQGLKIIGALVKALNGEIDQCFGSHGAISIISFPNAEAGFGG